MKSKKYNISVGEPWDFESPNGKNIIEGQIIRTISPTCLIFKANHIITFKGYSGDIFVLTPRYSKEDFKEFQTAPYITINGGLLNSNYDEEMSEDEFREKSNFFVIGSIRSN